MAKVIRYRIKDVGRPKHHYLLVHVLRGKGVRGGRTVGKLITREELRKRAAKARKVWMKMSHKTRVKVAPSRAGRAGYKRVRKVIRKKRKRVVTHIWVKKKK